MGRLDDGQRRGPQAQNGRQPHLQLERFEAAVALLAVGPAAADFVAGLLQTTAGDSGGFLRQGEGHLFRSLVFSGGDPPRLCW
jgi:hypothetical protein